MTTLKSQIIDDVQSVFLATNDFAEVVTYSPNEGESRSVTVVIEGQDEFAETDHSTEKIEIVRVFCDRAATGIPTPAFGDAIKRAADADPGQRVYAFTGDVEMVEASTWWLLFRRNRQNQYGIGQKGRM
jgi:hypothetical protein